MTKPDTPMLDIADKVFWSNPSFETAIAYRLEACDAVNDGKITAEQYYQIKLATFVYLYGGKINVPKA